MKHVHFYCLSLYEEHIKTKAIRNEIYIHRSKLICHEFYKNQEHKQKNRNILKTTILKNNILNKSIKHNALQLNNLRNFCINIEGETASGTYKKFKNKKAGMLSPGKNLKIRFSE